jgi:hypothetical protein
MTVILFLVIVALFVALTPGILLSLPPKGSKLVVALTHGIVFAIVLKLIYKPIWKFTSRMEGLKELDEKEDEAIPLEESMIEGVSPMPSKPTCDTLLDRRKKAFDTYLQSRQNHRIAGCSLTQKK